jgi:hypothetical protein
LRRGSLWLNWCHAQQHGYDHKRDRRQPKTLESSSHSSLPPVADPYGHISVGAVSTGMFLGKSEISGSFVENDL